ncbi:MAG: carbonic anhydrase [Bdellovibrionales bacterium]|nr:carbonic anhydrase [Bdellovibrionales bacterium]
MDSVKKLLLGNKAWAQSKTSLNANYFKDMARDQKPDHLWISCSDSRVPSNEVTSSDPGEMFVHRNIANLVVHTDLNILGVVQYAVEVLKVKHIIVCGHYNCGGIRAAMSPANLGVLNAWIRNIKDTFHKNTFEFEKITNETDRVNKLVELNVVQQVKNLSYMALVQKEWKTRGAPAIHGWVYDINTGIIKELMTIMPNDKIDAQYKYDL